MEKYRTNEEYIAELAEIFKGLENYKVRWFYNFITAKLKMKKEK